MSFIMNQNDKNKVEKFGMTQNELNELRYHYVDRYVENMSTKDLIQYVFDDYFDELVEEIKGGQFENDLH